MRFFRWGWGGAAGESAVATAKPVMRCHYEVLGVVRNATGEEITRAFRQGALRLHPDKNPHRTAEAAEEFKELRRAYEVLSDPHEREWYDNHREDILHGRDPTEEAGAGGNGGGGDASAASPIHRATQVDLYAYFQPSAYSGYDDGPKSFYAVYGGVFSALSAEEEAAGARPAPALGAADAPWAAVSAFYRHWESFVSSKSFGFADMWNLAEAPDRVTRRAMERENRRARERTRREFQQLVTELVTFVKRRDRRVQHHQEEALRRAAAAREQASALQEQREQLRAMHAARLAAQLEEDLPNLDELLQHLEEAHIGSAQDVRGTQMAAAASEAPPCPAATYFCVACKKQFKSRAQWGNHESSKRHRDSVRQLRKSLRVGRDEELKVCVVSGDDIDEEDREVSSDVAAEQTDGEIDGDRPEAEEGEVTGDDTQCRTAQASRRADRRDGDSESSARMPDPSVNDDASASADADAATDINVPGAVEHSGKHAPKKEKKRRRATTASKNASQNQCGTCRETFPTRNALFRHLREMDHAQYR